MAPLTKLRLTGCSPTPLAYYLKGLGLFRLVAERYPESRAWWEQEAFVLKSPLEYDSLIKLLLEDYAPTPIVAPWNGGSGFFQADKEKKIAPLLAIEASSHPRLGIYRETLKQSRRILTSLNLDSKPDPEKKQLLLELCRNEFPEAALEWLDTVYVLTDQGAKYPPLLGTGGIDGRLEFTNNFMQRLVDLIDMQMGLPTEKSRGWLDATLSGKPAGNLMRDAAIGQFFPLAVGGANASVGFESDSLVNPWDFILMIEGTLLFAASCVKRMGKTGPGVLAYPFTVRQVGVGYASASQKDEQNSRAEMWLPLWERPCSLTELKTLFSEGKVQVGRRQAVDGIDFTRAVATLGVDRGITAFQRYGFQVRNGQAYFAIPIGRVEVKYQPEAELLTPIDEWLRTMRSKASGGRGPAGISRVLNRLERAIWDLCNRGGTVRTTSVLIALGQCEQATAKLPRWVNDSGVRPIPPLHPEWVYKADDGSIEFRLAAALASLYGRFGEKRLPLRSHLEPVRVGLGKDGTGFARWDDTVAKEVVWQEGYPLDSLNRIMQRRLILAEKAGHSTWSDTSKVWAGLENVTPFIEGLVNLEAFSQFLWGLILIDWARFDASAWTHSPWSGLWPGAAYALLKLCFAGHRIHEVEVPLNPTIHHQAAIGRGTEATSQAARRLTGSALPPAVKGVTLSRESSRNTAAALLFPLWQRDIRFLASRVLQQSKLQ
jgi:CRISPR-associated protein Csx17